LGKVLAGREVRLGEGGEILVRGAGVAAGYWNGQDLQAVANEEGWYGTGDIGEVDAGGNLYFKGRKKDVIVTSAGMNIYPDDLEAALRKQSGVRDCAVVAVDTGLGAEPCAILIFTDNAVEAESVVKRANETVAEVQRINTWLIWPESDFPRTSTQKVKKNELTGWAQTQLGSLAYATHKGPLAEMIARVIGRTLPDLRAEANLETDLNLTSLERVELMSALEDRYQIDVSESRFAAANTVGDLEKILQGDPTERAVYHYPRWALRWPLTWIRLLVHYTLLRPAVFLLGWPRVTGRENLRGLKGPVLVVCNHVDDVDVGYVLT